MFLKLRSLAGVLFAIIDRATALIGNLQGLHTGAPFRTRPRPSSPFLALPDPHSPTTGAGNCIRRKRSFPVGYGIPSGGRYISLQTFTCTPPDGRQVGTGAVSVSRTRTRPPAIPANPLLFLT
ncbi:hypothetical protein D9758_004264 [Tetrapyrgos nigripes]|uniref:Secreted protein n=1 Tax=Tetrapyrgos nigripes TaxID=182062 RepID=A0A8H5GUU1_9AGAR|nr:hypothetical protein D9758_004264 [Tetrapyrgos nigripes]